MASSSTMIVAVASALCVHTILAYPTSIERVSGDNNYLPLRNSPSRDLDRFIDTFCDDSNQCNLPSGVLEAAAWDSLDRFNGGHTLMAKRSSLDRLNGGHVMTAKRSSLDRLNGGHIMTAKRSSLDRLNGGHVMTAKRSSLDRLNGGHVMTAKRSSLDRLNGGHVMVARRSQPERFNDDLAVVTRDPLPAPQLLQQQPPKSPRSLTRWSETDVQSFNDDYRDNYYSKDGDDYDGDDCQGCGSSAKASSF